MIYEKSGCLEVLTINHSDSEIASWKWPGPPGSRSEMNCSLWMGICNPLQRENLFPLYGLKTHSEVTSQINVSKASELTMELVQKVNKW